MLSLKQIIILNILNNHDSYPYEIYKNISELTNSDFNISIATIYDTIKELNNMKFIKRLDTKSANIVNNKIRVYYTITKLGHDKLYDSKRIVKALIQ